MRCFFLMLLMFSALLNTAQDFNVKSVTPVDLANSDAEELMPLFDRVSQSLYFTRVAYVGNIGGSDSGSDIWQLPMRTNSVAKATNKFNWNNRLNNAVIGINTDGLTVYLLNGYNKQSGITFSRNLNGTWTKPETVIIPGLSSNGFKGYFMSPDFKYLLISMKSKDSFGEEDIYVSVKQENGKWAKPVNLGASINTTGFEISPFLSGDGKTLFFASNGQAGFGSADIYMAKRLYDSWDVWTKPQNLGNSINSDGFDAYFSVYDSIAFFSSNRQGKLSDIYKVRLENISLAKGKTVVNFEILSDAEIVNLFGFIFDPLIEFERNTGTLTARDRELLWFIAEKLSKRNDVKIGLYQIGNSNDRQRSQLIIDYLSSLNFSIERIETELGEWKPTTSKFFKEDNIQLFFIKQ